MSAVAPIPVTPRGYNTIAFRADRCDGCGDCMSACAKTKFDSTEPARALLSIVGDAERGFELATCRQCGEPKCVMNCPAAALSKNPETGVIDWSQPKCVNCLLCTVGCAYAGISFDAQARHVVKCDLCDGDPACVTACPHDALQYRRAGELYARQGAREDLFVAGLAACQGCNSELMIRHGLRYLGSETVVAAPPGCIPGMGTVGYNGKTGAKVPIFHPLLTNTAAMLTGIKRYYNRVKRDVTVLALAGDGGTSDAGFHALSGAAERNEQILFVCVDNEGYMNTGMQSSGSTSYGSWTSTTPVGPAQQGKQNDGKNLARIMMMHNCEYVATANLAFIEDFFEKLEKAHAATRRGMAYLHIYAPCPTGWRFPSAATIEVCRKGVETNFFPLWEYTPTGGLQFNYDPDAPMPLRNYVNLMGKYRHLSDAQLTHLQGHVANEIAILKTFQRPAATGTA